jgi:hypothetical protein
MAILDFLGFLRLSGSFGFLITFGSFGLGASKEIACGSWLGSADSNDPLIFVP